MSRSVDIETNLNVHEDHHDLWTMKIIFFNCESIHMYEFDSVNFISSLFYA